MVLYKAQKKKPSPSCRTFRVDLSSELKLYEARRDCLPKKLQKTTTEAGRLIALKKDQALITRSKHETE